MIQPSILFLLSVYGSDVQAATKDARRCFDEWQPSIVVHYSKAMLGKHGKAALLVTDCKEWMIFASCIYVRRSGTFSAAFFAVVGTAPAIISFSFSAIAAFDHCVSSFFADRCPR
jgi:hypothetical protein